MNCSKCGLPALADQKFCRSCGASLQMTTQPLGEPATVSDHDEPIAFKGGPPGSSRVTLWGFIIMFIGVAIGIVGKMLLHQDAITVVGVLLSLLGMFLTAYPFLAPAPRRKVGSVRASRTDALTPSQSTRYLPPLSNAAYVPSITDRTTDLLETPASTKTRQKQDEVSQD